jgi:predicted Zn-dependent peptidase
VFGKPTPTSHDEGLLQSPVAIDVNVVAGTMLEADANNIVASRTEDMRFVFIAGVRDVTGSFLRS